MHSGAARPASGSSSHGAGSGAPTPRREDPSSAAIRGSALCQDAIALGLAGRGADALGRVQVAVEFVRGLFGVVDREGLRLLGSRLAEVQEMLRRLGYCIEAVQVAHDAVTFRRGLAGTTDGVDAPELAASLNALASALANVGRHAQAAEVAREEVALRRELARDRNADRLHQLANGLRDLGRWLGRAGGEARQTARLMHEALDILRPLATGGPIKARSDLARTSLALATFLGDRGRAAEAIPPGLEAVAMHRELAKAADPQRVAPELAKALHNVSIWLSQVGRHGDAFVAADEAVTLYRSLMHSNATNAVRDLAWSLVTLGNRLADMRNREQAQRMHREAAALVLRLPVHDHRLWTWLASVPATTLSLPQDLHEFHLPLLHRLTRTEFAWGLEAADTLTGLQEQVAARARVLLATLPVQHKELFDAGVAALLGPTYGARVTRWACAHDMGRRLIASPGSWAAQRCRRDW